MPLPQALTLLSALFLFQSCQKTLEPSQTAQSTEGATGAKKGGHDKGLDIELVVEGYESPLGVVDAEDNSKRLFVIDQPGRIWIIDKAVLLFHSAEKLLVEYTGIT